MATVNSMKALGRLVIVKATKGGTDAVLYSQHTTKIGSHNGQGEVDYYQNLTDTGMRGPAFEPNLFWKSNNLISLQGLIFLLFTHFHHH